MNTTSSKVDDSPPSATDWGAFVLIVLAIGPAIGGFIVGVFFQAAPLFLHGTIQWSYLSLGIGLAVSHSYFLGEPIAALALIILIILRRLWPRSSMLLAIFSSLVAATIVAVVWVLRGPVQANLTNLLGELVLLYVPSVIATVACLRMTKPLLKLP